MDFETQRKKRLEALEEKKKRIEEMKKLKEERELSQNAASSSLTTNSALQEKNDIDNLVNSLLLTTAKTTTSENQLEASTIAASVPTIEPSKQLPSEVIPPKIKKLTVVKQVASISLAPRAIETYDKNCQTDPIPTDTNDGRPGDGESNDYDGTTPHKLQHRRVATAAGVTSTSAGPTTAPLSPRSTEVVNTAPRRLTEDELKGISQREDFLHFLHTASRTMDRALGQNSVYDILQNYQLNRGRDRSGASRALVVINAYEDDSTRHRPITDLQFSPHFPELFLVAYGAKASQHHAKKSSNNPLKSAPLPSSTLTTSTHQEEPMGLVYVWSTGIPNRPEFKFYASSPMLAAKFHPHDEHIVVGGSYTGQLLQWDMRGKSLPVQRSSLTGKGHKHPICSLQYVPSLSVGSSSTAAATTAAISGLTSHSTTTSNTAAVAYELVTGSMDGCLCYWDISRLLEPTNVVQLTSLLPATELQLEGDSTVTSQLPLTLTSMSFVSNLSEGQGPRDVIFGSGTGQLYSGALPLRPSHPLTQLEGHQGFVSAMEVQTNPHGAKAFNHLLLTSSLDWSMKLWNVTYGTTHIASGATVGTALAGAPLHKQSRPVLEFVSPTYDYVTDVHWCPVHCGAFVSTTAGGCLSLWDICKSIAEPVETLNLFGDVEPGSTTLAAALSKCAWSKTGRLLLVGDSKGTATLVSVSEAAVSFTPADQHRWETVLTGAAGSTAEGSGEGGNLSGNSIAAIDSSADIVHTSTSLASMSLSNHTSLASMSLSNHTNKEDTA